MSIPRFLVTLASKVSLQTVLVIPFVLQLVGTVGLVGYLSYRNGQEALKEVASQLRSEICDRVQLYLKNYLATPHLINRINVDAVRVGQLDVKDLSQVERHLILQLQQFDSVSGILFSDNRGNFRASTRHTPQPSIMVSDLFDTTKISIYPTDSLGNRSKLWRTFRQPDMRERPWYKIGASCLKPTWTPIFSLGDRSGFSINANLPIYALNNQELLGVFSIALNLKGINEFLNGLRVGKSGQVFIIERNGFLVGNSTSDRPYILTPQQELRRLKGTESNNSLIAATSRYLTEKFGSQLASIKNSQQLDFQINGKSQFLQVVPFQDKFGLDWLVVVVVPEADFMEQINAHTRITIFLCVAASILATGSGILTSRWLTQPIEKFHSAAQKIARGEWDKRVRINRSYELVKLADSFNLMAEQLQASFAEIRENESRLTQFLEAIPVGVTIHDITGKTIYTNQTAKEILGMDNLTDTQIEKFTENYQIYLSGTRELYPVENWPIVKALSGESTMVDDMDLYWQDRIIPLQIWGSPVYDNQGQITHGIVAFIDITEQKKAQNILANYNRTLENELAQRTADLQESEQFLRSIYEGIEASVFIVDVLEDGEFRYVGINPAHERLTGLASSQLIGKTPEEILIPEMAEMVSEHYRACIAAGKTISYEECLVIEGKETWWITSLTPICDSNERIYRIIGTSFNINQRKQAEEALKESQHFIQRVANASPNIWYIYDIIEQRNVYTNREIAAILGYTSAEIQAMGAAILPEIIHPDDMPKVLEHHAGFQRASDDDILEIEYRMRNHREEWLTILSRDTVFARNPDGRVQQIIGTATDITERKKAEEALEESIEKQQAIAKSIQRMRQTLDVEDIFYTTTSELRNVLNCDRTLIYRFHPDWSGEFVAESVAPEWISLLQEKCHKLDLEQNFLQEPCDVKQWRVYPEFYTDTYMQETEGGSYAQGTIYRVINDIYQSELAPCYIELLERFQVKSYIVVPIFCGDKLWGLLGTYQNSSPRHWNASEINIVVQIAMQLGVALQQAQLLQQTQQQSAQLQVAKEAAEAANQTKSQFLSNMSHELRTPLNAILGFSQLMKKSSHLSPEDRENLKIIIRSGEHLVTLINQVLDLAKIEAGKITVNETPLDLFGMLDDLENMFQFKANQQGVHLVFECSDDVPQYVKTDGVKLHQVLINLLSNAIKFTKEGSIYLRVTNRVELLSDRNLTPQPPSLQGQGELEILSSSLQGQGELEILSSSLQGQPEILPPSPLRGGAGGGVKLTTINFQVSDTGIGIPPEELENIFAEFTQASLGKLSPEGTGLGLSISHKFVQMMGGKILVDSIVDKGSTFQFDIKVSLVEPEAIPTPQPTRQVIALEPNQPRYRILIVDDKKDNRQLLIQLLSQFGFAVREASNGRQAIEVWETWQPHLIFMDIRMPVMDGLEATQEIRKCQNSPFTKIIAMTAGTLEEKRDAALAAGCDDFLLKPFREAEILAMMSKLIGVRFVYDEPTLAPDGDMIEVNSLNPDALSTLTVEFLASLHQATFEGDLEEILALIEEIPDKQLAKALASLAHNLQYKEILKLTQPRNTNSMGDEPPQSPIVK